MGLLTAGVSVFVDESVVSAFSFDGAGLSFVTSSSRVTAMLRSVLSQPLVATARNDTGCNEVRNPCSCAARDGASLASALGQPSADEVLVALIGRMARENPICGNRRFSAGLGRSSGLPRR